MMIAVTVLLGLLAPSFAALYWRGLREARSLSEFAQHLLLEPESYADHRGKFLGYLAGTAAKTSMKRSVDAGAVLARIAESMRPTPDFIEHCASQRGSGRAHLHRNPHTSTV
jgi:hypothetical protein